MMNKKDIFRKIGGIISELTEQYQYLSDNFEEFNELELELFTANAHFLADHIEILRKLSSKNMAAPNVASEIVEEKFAPDPEPIQKAQEVSQELAAKEISVEEPIKPSAADVLFNSYPVESIQKFDFENKALDELYDREFTAEEQAVIERKAAISESPIGHSSRTRITEEVPAVPPVIIPEKNVTEPARQPVTASAVTPAPTVNDIISAHTPKSTLATGFNRQQSGDLKSAISLNDKLLFIKDLFNGYSLAYSEAIEILNRFDSFEAAENFLTANYAQKNNWETRQNTVEKLYELLRQRYAK